MNNFLRKLNLRGSTQRWARKTTGIAVGALLLSSGVAKAQLSGTYTICASGCDYSTIQSAADDLKNLGVSGAVTMQIKPGSYNENVSIGSISGVSATNTVTFIGTGSNPTDVWVYSSTGTPWAMNGADRITVDNIHVELQYSASGNYGMSINSSKNITVQNCRITAPIGSYIYQNHAMLLQSNTNVMINKNWLRGGGYSAIDCNNSGYNTGLTIQNNLLTKFYYYGIFMYYNTDSKYLNNVIDSCGSGTTQYGIYTYGGYGTNAIKGNTIKGSAYYFGYNYSYGTDLVDSNFATNTYYGCTMYGLSSASDITFTRNLISGQYYAVYLYTSGKIKAYNNMLSTGGSGSYTMYVYPLNSAASFDVAHNTIYYGGGSYTLYYYNYYAAKDVKIRNNIFYNSGNGYPYLYSVTTGNIIDYNDIVRSNGSFNAVVNSSSYSSLSSYQAALASFNTGQHEQSAAVTFVSAPSDLHLDHTNPAPFGTGIGIARDYDNDLRCTIMPTVGADETKNKTGDNYKSLTGTTKFTGPSKSYIGYPTTFFNSAASTSRLGYSWYVDGVKVSDSFHLTTTALKYPKSVIKLEAYNCSSIDSFKFTVTVDSPATVPTSDFISDVNVIRQGESVQFNDLSTGYPSSWTWDITPQSGLLNGSPASAYKYTYGSKSTSVNKVRFDIPGKYKVCLTASNAKGKGNTECKVDYVEVTPAVIMSTSLQTLTASSGYIYDNGGPNGNTQAAYYYNSPLPRVLIDACADSVYLVFKMFDMGCPYDYLQIYDGKDKTGKPLSCTSNMYSGAYGPGFTGSATSGSCAQNCSPMHLDPATSTLYSDTIKASKYMYLEMQSNNPGQRPGFEAYYWTKPRSQAKPKASFTSVDSICTNGQVIFTNTTVGSDVTYLWDLDDDMSFFEATSKNTNWPYFAPGTYKITLIAMNCGGSDTFSKTISVFNPKPPVTSFTADNVTPTTSDVVFFSKDMPMCVDDYTWTITPSSGSGKATYVNGSKNTSSNPNVMFSDPGCYDVQLVTKNVSGQDQLKLTCFINVRGSYCVPTTQNKAADLGISNVKFNTLNNTSPQGTTSYTNYALDQTKSTTIEIGVTYDLTVARATNKNKISRTAWIDWNADGDFDDAGEKVGEQLNSSTLSWTTPVKVPTLAKTGATILRIAVNQGSQSNTACGPNVFGEYEDYRVYVRPDATKPVIVLNDKDTIKIEQGATFVDPGATASDNLDGNVTSKIKVTTVPKFDNMTPGTYVFKYNVTDAAGNQADEVRRIVIVGPDMTPPNLVVPDPETIHVEVFDATFTVPDAVLAEDAVDGDLLSEVKKTSNVNISVVGTYEVVYTVTDASGNTATVKRTVIVEDLTAPTMALVGNQTITLEVGSTYTDAGVTVSDNYYAEADLRNVLVMQSNVDPNVLGTYTVVYTLTDPSGNGPVTVTRTVIVVDTQAPVANIIGEDPITMEVNNKFADPGVTIADNYDKNLNTWDTAGTFYATFPDGYANQLGTYVVSYIVTDASGNVTTVNRTVIVKDMTAPTVTLTGEDGVSTCRWSNYVDAGITYKDNFDPNGQLTIEKEGTFVTYGTQVAGLWSLRYKVTDKSGNVSYSGWRSILVQEPGTGACLTGINETAIDKYVNVYPNPSTGKFTVKIELPAAEQTKITVTNLVGQQVAVVAEGMMSANTISVDLSNQASGVYMLNIQTPTHNVVKRIVVNK